MNKHKEIKNLYAISKSYPELVKGLINLGVLSYTVDVSSGTILYRFSEGELVLHEGEGTPRKISDSFSQEKTFAAVKATQQGKTTYPEFMQEIADAGVRFYESTLNGNQKRVTYIGSGGHYEELIPI